MNRSSLEKDGNQSAQRYFSLTEESSIKSYKVRKFPHRSQDHLGREAQSENTKVKVTAPGRLSMQPERLGTSAATEELAGRNMASSCQIETFLMLSLPVVVNLDQYTGTKLQRPMLREPTQFKASTCAFCTSIGAIHF